MSSANLKSEIAPKGMKFNVNDFIISDKYATILTIISYPKTIQPGFLSNVTNIPGIKVVVKHIPIPFSSMQKMLNREIVDLKDRYQKERDRTLQERLRQDYESLEAFVQMLAATQSKNWDFQMHIMITADTKEELENKRIANKNKEQKMIREIRKQKETNKNNTISAKKTSMSKSDVHVIKPSKTSLKDKQHFKQKRRKPKI